MSRRSVLPEAGEEGVEALDASDGASAGRGERLGLASFLLGGLALPAASFPWLGVPAALLAGVGAVLGIVGLVQGWKQQGRLRFSAIGLGACLVGLLVALWPGPRRSPPRPGEDTQEVVRLRGTPAGPSRASTSRWGDASREAVQQGGVRVRVLAAVVQTVPLEDSAGQQRRSEGPGLVLRLRLSNVGLDRPVRYLSWSAPADPADGPALVDHLGRAYPAQTFGPGWTVSGQARQAGLAPGKWADDVLVFAPPPPDVPFLRLTLPAAAFGGKGALRLELPRPMIVFH